MSLSRGANSCVGTRVCDKCSNLLCRLEMRRGGGGAMLAARLLDTYFYTTCHPHDYGCCRYFPTSCDMKWYPICGTSRWTSWGQDESHLIICIIIFQVEGGPRRILMSKLMNVRIRLTSCICNWMTCFIKLALEFYDGDLLQQCSTKCDGV